MGVPDQSNIGLEMVIDEEKYKPKGWRGKLKYLLQKFFFLFRDNKYYNYKATKKHNRISRLIEKDTYWLTTSALSRGVEERLPFYEQATKYFEYKNAVGRVSNSCLFFQRSIRLSKY